MNIGSRDKRKVNESRRTGESSMVLDAATRAGSYSISDVRRVLGDPVKGLGLSLPLSPRVLKKR